MLTFDCREHLIPQIFRMSNVHSQTSLAAKCPWWNALWLNIQAVPCLWYLNFCLTVSLLAIHRSREGSPTRADFECVVFLPCLNPTWSACQRIHIRGFPRRREGWIWAFLLFHIVIQALACRAPTFPNRESNRVSFSSMSKSLLMHVKLRLTIFCFRRRREGWIWAFLLFHIVIQALVCQALTEN